MLPQATHKMAIIDRRASKSGRSHAVLNQKGIHLSQKCSVLVHQSMMVGRVP